jgi:hypothetical protein
MTGCEGNGSNGHPFDLEVLVGKWEDISKQNAQFEEWQWDGNGGLVGQGFVMADADTVFIENLSIGEVDGVLTYVARVSNQNEDKPVNFGLFADEGNRLIFENRQHDFPQRIVYEIISKDEMSAYIEGIEDGTFRQIKFSFQRME